MVLRSKIHLTLHFLRCICQNPSIEESYHKSIPYSTPKITWEQALNPTPLSQEVTDLLCMHKVTLQHPIDAFQSIASAKQVIQRQRVYKPWQHLILVSKVAHEERIKLLYLCIINSQHVWSHAFHQERISKYLEPRQIQKVHQLCLNKIWRWKERACLKNLIEY